MKAFLYETAGVAAEVMRPVEVETPRPAEGEVLVRVVWSTINPTDVKRRTTGRELGKFSPIIPNNDGSGVIEAVGAGVPEARIGERVWLFGAQAARPHGSAAEYVALPSRLAQRLPDGVDLRQGACLGVPAVTAHRGLFADGPIAGQSILITGGSGRVGNCAVQLAKRAGARVIATASGAEKIAEVKARGADLVLDYKSDDLVAAARDFTDGAMLDRVVDTSFSTIAPLAPDLIKPNGVLTAYASDADPNPPIPFVRLMYQNVLIRPFSIYGMPRAAQDAAFAHLAETLKQAPLEQRVDREMGFDQMIEAHTVMETEKLWGCLLVRVGES